MAYFPANPVCPSSCFSDRGYQIKTDGILFEATCLSDVPQESVIGLLLFGIYIYMICLLLQPPILHMMLPRSQSGRLLSSFLPTGAGRGNDTYQSSRTRSHASLLGTFISFLDRTQQCNCTFNGPLVFQLFTFISVYPYVLHNSAATPGVCIRSQRPNNAS